MTPYFQREGITIYHGDCLEIMPQLDEKFDLILTDPPYGITQNKWDIEFNDIQLFKCRGAIIIFTAQPYTSKLIYLNMDIFKYEIIWFKSKSTGFLDCSKRPMRSHENILIFGDAYKTYNPQKTKGIPWVRGRLKRPKSNWGEQKVNYSQNESGFRQPLSVLYCENSNNNSYHPTQKPIKLIKNLILTYSNINEIVLDPFLGSGTSLVAAAELNRRGVGIEIEEKYCEIAVKRIEKVLNQTRLDL